MFFSFVFFLSFRLVKDPGVFIILFFLFSCLALTVLFRSILRFDDKEALTFSDDVSKTIVKDAGVFLTN